MSGSEELTGIMFEATLESPLASVTRSCTRWLPAEEKVVLIAGPPAANAPVPARSQAKAVMGLALSVELETNETAWPKLGMAGNQVNDAAGGADGRAADDDDGDDDEPTTTNVLVALTPTLPARSGCTARTVYVPGESPPNVPDHAFPTVLRVRLCTGTCPAPIDEPENS
jgi:hypothetical protein